MDYFEDFLQGSSNTNGNAIVSGTNVRQEPEEEFDLNALMADVNSANIEVQQTQDEKASSAKEAAEEADRKAREEARAKHMAEKAEKERLEREQFLEAQKEEEERLAAEQAAKQQANPLNKLTGMFVKSRKNEISKPQSIEKQTTITDSKAPLTDNINIENCADSSETVKAQTTAEETIPKDKPAEEIKKIGKRFGGKMTNKSLKTAKINTNQNITQTNNKNSQSVVEKPDFEFLATHDSLTKLLNRTAFDMKISTISADNLSVIFFDINNLKKTNDTYGHEFGNKLITATASKLAELFPECVYRIGGDEFIVLTEGIGPKVIDKRIETIRAYLNKKTSEDKDGLIYAVAVGYAIGDGKKSLLELQEEADKAMYVDKAKYKKEHPELNGRPEETKQTQPENYDELLNKSQRELKEIVREGHIVADEDKTERILSEVQSRYQEVLAIFIADAEFNSLYIIRDVRNFLAMASEMEDMIDYSYFYVVYEGGPQYYGADDYMTEVTHLFEEITNNLRYNRSLNSKEIAKIPGINIFKNIYFDC